MRILTHDELDNSFDPQVQLLHLGTEWSVIDFERVKQIRIAGYPAADYYSVYAVEGSEVLAKVEAIHIRYEMPGGPEIMAGISGVVTRRDRSREGLAKQLLLDVHKRERASGIRYSLLWTGRHNRAHSLYKSIGYVDIFDPGVALIKTRRVENRNIHSNEVNVRTAQRADAPLMEELYSKAAAHRLGFTKRYKGFAEMAFSLEFDKPSSYRIFSKGDRGSEAIGYAQFQDNPVGWIRSSEVVLVKEEERYLEPIIQLLEDEANGKWLAFSHSFIFNQRKLLEEKRGYAFSIHTYETLMACDLDNEESAEDMIKLLGTSDPIFTCQRFDHF
jgi:GNAT superfamily N-acetyltransferase